MAKLVNERLIEWKIVGLPSEIERLTRHELQRLVIMLEKRLLQVDLRIKALKDKLDEAARFVPPPDKPKAKAPEVEPGTRELVHVLGQRKAILMAVLGKLKRRVAAM